METLIKPSSCLLRTLAILIGLVLTTSAQPGDAPVRTANPFKESMPYSGIHTTNNLPYSMEFFYLPRKDLMSGASSFTWNNRDSRAGRGRQAVLRVYLDYPKQASGVPEKGRMASEKMPMTSGCGPTSSATTAL